MQTVTKARSTYSNLALLAAILAIAISAPQAFAHALLFQSNPAPNSVVSGPNLAIKLRFNVRIDASRSRLTLLFPGGALHVLQLETQQPADMLAADASSLAPGHYDLKWQVLASDGHITQGDIPFAVK